MENTQYIEAYTQFRSRLSGFETYGELISNDWLPEKISLPVVGQHLCYAHMLGDFSDELAYTINQFLTNIRKLYAWKEIIHDYYGQERLDVIDEFIEPISVICLNLPYSIKGRFESFVTRISHQANIINNDSYKDDLPKIRKINNEVMKKIAAPWSSFENLRSNLELLNDEQYQLDTNEYRHRYHHRGISQSVERIIEKSKVEGEYEVSYVIKQPKSLKLQDIISVSKAQHEVSYKCYESYQCLVKEQAEKILNVTIDLS